jgi:hypothetical protein
MGIHLQTLHSSQTSIAIYQTTRRISPNIFRAVTISDKRYGDTIRSFIVGENRQPRIPEELVGTATGYGLEGRRWIPSRDTDFSPLHIVQASSGAQQVSYPMGGYRSLFPWA